MKLKEIACFMARVNQRLRWLYFTSGVSFLPALRLRHSPGHIADSMELAVNAKGERVARVGDITVRQQQHECIVRLISAMHVLLNTQLSPDRAKKLEQTIKREHTNMQSLSSLLRLSIQRKKGLYLR